MSEERCLTCPLRDHEESRNAPCYAITRPHRRLCDLQPQYYNVVLASSGFRHLIVDKGKYKRQASAVVRSARPGKTVEPAILLEVANCPHRGDRIGCGCGDLRVCLDGKGKNYGAKEPGVMKLDCIVCIEAKHKAE